MTKQEYLDKLADFNGMHRPKPKWQRARIINVEPVSAVMLGHELWVQAGPPFKTAAVSEWTNQPCDPELCYRVAMAHYAVIPVWAVELLARDENDFAESVDLVPWEQFLAECRANSPLTPERRGRRES